MFFLVFRKMFTKQCVFVLLNRIASIIMLSFRCGLLLYVHCALPIHISRQTHKLSASLTYKLHQPDTRHTTTISISIVCTPNDKSMKLPRSVFFLCHSFFSLYTKYRLCAIHQLNDNDDHKLNISCARVLCHQCQPLNSIWPVLFSLALCVCVATFTATSQAHGCGQTVTTVAMKQTQLRLHVWVLLVFRCKRLLCVYQTSDA